MSRSIRQRCYAAAAIGVAVATSALAIGAGAAYAGTNGQTSPISNNSCDITAANGGPAGCTQGVVGSGASFTYPGRFTPSTVQAIRSSGSDTTFFMMQAISNLYNQAALYGGTLSSDETTLENGQNGTPAGDDANTDDIDNFSRTEVQTGIDEVGSGGGLAQLCDQTNGTNVASLPAGFKVDFSRSSTEPVAKATSLGFANCVAAAPGGLGLTGMGYAVDGVPAIDFPSVNPAAYAAYIPCAINIVTCEGEPGGTFSLDTYLGYVGPGVTKNVEENSGQPAVTITGAEPDGSVLLGPVAAGWLPGDNVNGPYSGTAFQNVTNTIAGGANGIAYRLWCAKDSSRITDWGQLTNLDGGTVAVGSGAAIGVPITIWGVNPASGTLSVFTSWAKSGGTGGDSGVCANNANVNPNGAPGVGNAGDVALENNAAQLASLAAADNGLGAGVHGTNLYGATGVSGQAEELSASLYYMSFGVTQTNNYATSVAITNNGTTVTYPGYVMQENGRNDTALLNLQYKFATSRVLYNAYLAATVRASTASFLNWICDDNNVFNKNTDYETGLNYDAELTTIIQNDYGFARLADDSAGGAVNNSDGCNLITSVSQNLDPASQELIQAAETLGNNQLTVLAGPPTPLNLPVGAPISGPGIANGTTITAVVPINGGGDTVTISSNATATAAGAYLTVTGGLKYNQE